MGSKRGKRGERQGERRGRAGGPFLLCGPLPASFPHLRPPHQPHNHSPTTHQPPTAKTPHQMTYIASTRELKRLDSLANSPIFSHFKESLEGLATIRAFGKQGLFLEKNKVGGMRCGRVRMHGGCGPHACAKQGWVGAGPLP
jgi:hypothetical protein